MVGSSLEMALKRDYSEQEYTAPNAYSADHSKPVTILQLCTHRKTLALKILSSIPKAVHFSLLEWVQSHVLSVIPFNLMHCIMMQPCAHTGYHCHKLHIIMDNGNMNPNLDGGSCSSFSQLIMLNISLRVGSVLDN